MKHTGQVGRAEVAEQRVELMEQAQKQQLQGDQPEQNEEALGLEFSLGGNGMEDIRFMRIAATHNLKKLLQRQRLLSSNVTGEAGDDHAESSRLHR